MINAYRKTVAILNKVYMAAAVVLLVVIIIAAAVQVFTRKVLGNSVVGTEELCRYCFIWLSCLGASLCVSKRNHAVMDVLNQKLKGRAKHIHTVFIHILMIAFSFVLAWFGIRLLGFVSRQLSPTLRIPMSYIYFAAFLMGFGIIVNGIDVVLQEVAKIRNNAADDAGGESP